MSMPPRPPEENDAIPLQQRSQSQNNKLAIRVVPYTPPRLSSGASSNSGDYVAVKDEETFCSSRGSSRGAEDPNRRSDGGLLESSSSLSRLAEAEDRDSGVSASKPDGGAGDAVSTPVPQSETSDMQQAAPGTHPQRNVAVPSPALPGPLSRRRNYVALHSDNKTFTLVRNGGLGSPRLSDSAKSFPCEPSSVEASSTTDDRPSSPLTSLSDRSSFSIPGGLRKVVSKKTLGESVQSTLAPRPDFQVYRDSDQQQQQQQQQQQYQQQYQQHHETSTHELITKASFASAQTSSTTSETSNYKVYGRSSFELSDLVPSSSHSNLDILGRFSPAGRPMTSTPPGTSDSEPNFVVHGDSTPVSPTHELGRLMRHARPAYSQESLRVPPLRSPAQKRSSEKLGSKVGRHARSIRSVESIDSLIAQDAGTSSIFAAQATIDIPGSSSFGRRGGAETSSGSQTQTEQNPWSAQQPLQPPFQMIPAHTHQWSSQLSTVVSESEDGSEPAPSMSPTADSIMVVGGDDVSSHPARSSVGDWTNSSSHSRRLRSVPSSLAAQLQANPGPARSTLSTDAYDSSSQLSSQLSSPSYLSPSYHGRRNSGVSGNLASPVVRDHDEHGDGLAELHTLTPKPSWSGLSNFFSNGNRNLHSSCSTRTTNTTNSFTSAPLPAWVRVYYGSGERRWFQRSPSFSEADDSSRPSSAVPGSASPSNDHFPLSLFSPRKRAREVHQQHRLSRQPSHPLRQQPAGPRAPPQWPIPRRGSLHIGRAESQRGEVGVIVRVPRKKTSSIWSPHLRMDRRAALRYSIWDPPRVSWSADSGIMGKRNFQIVLFTIGFVFPFAWMLAAVLPLPRDPRQQNYDTDPDDDDAAAAASPSADSWQRYRLSAADEARYESARWWRNLNRIMSLVGLFIIALVVVLTVVGLRHWGRAR